MNTNVKYLLGIGGLLFLIFFSAAMATYVISGLVLFAGLVAMSESIRPIKWLFSRTGNLVDLIIFGFSIYAMSAMGVTVAIGLGVAGLLFSVYYKPYLKSTMQSDKPKTRKSLWEQ